MHVIPVVNTSSLEEAERKIQSAAEFSEWIHVDIADGKFTPHMTGRSPEDIAKAVEATGKEIHVEVHLMVESPEGVIDEWLRTGVVKRIIIHLEAMTDSVYILEKAKRFGAEVMLAINPGTEVERLLAHVDDFPYMQILAVSPGPAGQELQPNVMHKISFLKEKAPNVKLEVDGGVTDTTAKAMKEAGADIIVSGSYIFNAEDPKSAYHTLQST